MAESQVRLDEIREYVDKTRVESEAMRAQATKEAQRLVEAAEGHAAQIVSDAKTTAERVRADSERELAAATQRRDSINSQLANVRQMLATLTNTAPVSLVGLPFPDDVDQQDEGTEAVAEAGDATDGSATDASGAAGENGSRL